MRWTSLSMMALWMFVPGACAPAFAQPPVVYRTITIHATVEAPAGTPRENIKLAVIGRRGGGYEKTNAQGMATLVCELPESVTTAWVALTPVVNDALSAEVIHAEKASYKALIQAAAFKHSYPVSLSPLTTEYSIVLAGEPAVQATGRLVYPVPSGQDITAEIYYDTHPLFSVPGLTSGNFVVYGIKRGAPKTLYVTLPHTELVHVISLTAAQTQNDIVLGDVVIPDPTESTRKVLAEFTNLAQVRTSAHRPQAANLGALFARTDGQKLYVMSLLRGTRARSPQRPPDEMPELPPGTYFIVPGIIGLNDEPRKLHELLLSGRLAEVEAAYLAQGVPKLVIPDDGQTSTISITIDAPKALAAVNSIP